jgi:hypothetical protein
MKKNSIGFGFENNIKLSERLIATGVGIISVGVVSIISGLLVDKTEWYVGGDQKTVDNIEDLYHSIRTQHNLD